MKLNMRYTLENPNKEKYNPEDMGFTCYRIADYDKSTVAYFFGYFEAKIALDALNEYYRRLHWTHFKRK